MNRTCNKCHINKVNIFAYWYGLRHCEECELKPFRDRIKYLQAEIDRGKSPEQIDREKKEKASNKKKYLKRFYIYVTLALVSPIVLFLIGAHFILMIISVCVFGLLSGFALAEALW